MCEEKIDLRDEMESSIEKKCKKSQDGKALWVWGSLSCHPITRAFHTLVELNVLHSTEFHYLA